MQLKTTDGPLRKRLVHWANEISRNMDYLTVLANQNDPFRIDTAASHRDGEWLAEQLNEKLGDRKFHIRGLHYALIGETKPDGTPYTNTDKDWLWLDQEATKAAAWLGYIPWEQLVDARNRPPLSRIHQEPQPESDISHGDVWLKIAEPLTPLAEAYDFKASQPCKLVIAGEKTSLDYVLGPIAADYQADLYLPSGEISETMVYKMAKTAHDDGRHMVVFYLGDCDPSGWQMPVSLARKLQGFETTEFVGLKWELHHVGLTPEQVLDLNLPSTPLKRTDARTARKADKWLDAMGVQQTEIDSIATLEPEVLDEIVRDAIDPFYDHTLDERVKEARTEWRERAQEIIDGALGRDYLESVQKTIDAATEHLEQVTSEFNDYLADKFDTESIDLPEFEIPEPITDEKAHGMPLVDSRSTFVTQCRQLIDHKTYES